MNFHMYDTMYCKYYFDLLFCDNQLITIKITMNFISRLQPMKLIAFLYVNSAYSVSEKVLLPLLNPYLQSFRCF